MGNYTLRTFRNFATKQLEGISTTPDLDVQVLLQQAMHYDKTQLLLFSDNHIPDEQLEWLYNAIEKRKSGLPVAYITGHKEFYGFDFIVTPQVLIPKPDTEILVERALEIILEKMDDSSNTEPLAICDMCTGSGCIGISVIKTLYAVDTRAAGTGGVGGDGAIRHRGAVPRARLRGRGRAAERGFALR